MNESPEKLFLPETEKELESLLESAAELVNDWLINQGNPKNIERAKLLDSTIKEADWTQIASEFLGITSQQISQNPKLLENQVRSLLKNFQGLLMGDKSDTNSARVSAVKIQSILNSHGLEFGETIEQLFDNIAQFSSINGQMANQSPESIRLQQTLALFAEADFSSDEFGTAIAQLISKYNSSELHSFEPSSIELTENNIIQDIIDEHPLPTFDFDDLLVKVEDENENQTNSSKSDSQKF